MTKNGRCSRAAGTAGKMVCTCSDGSDRPDCLSRTITLEENGEPMNADMVRSDYLYIEVPRPSNPHAELVPFVVEAHGRLGAEVLPFLRQHAPADPALRSVVLAQATREISIITQRGLAALLLAAEPRPVTA